MSAYIFFFYITISYLAKYTNKKQEFSPTYLP